MHQRQRVDAGLGLHQGVARPHILDLIGLDRQQAHHDLEIVLHPVMDFPDQGGLDGHRFPQPPVAVLDALGHLAHGLAQLLELAGRVRQIRPDGVMAAAIGDGDAAQIGDPLRHLPVGGEPDRDPGEQDHRDRQQEIDRHMDVGLAEQPLVALGEGDKDGIAEQGGVAQTPVMPGFEGIERAAIGQARLEGRRRDRRRRFRIVGGQDGAVAVIDHRHRALGQGMGAQQIAEPLHVQRDRHAAVEAAIGLQQRQLGSDHRPAGFRADAARAHHHALGGFDGVEDRQLRDGDALGQRHRRTDHRAMGIDPAEIGEIADPDHRVGQDIVAIAAHVADVLQRAHGAQDLLAGVQDFLFGGGGGARRLDQLGADIRTVTLDPLHALIKAHRDDRQQRDGDDQDQPLAQRPTGIGHGFTRTTSGRLFHRHPLTRAG